MLIGNLKDRPLPHLLYTLHSSRAVGTLIITLNDLRKAILFENGLILSAYSNLHEDSLGEVLLRSGSITVDDYLEAQAQVKQGKHLSQILLESNKLTPEGLSLQLNFQALSIIYSLFRWQTGYFEFADGKLPQKEIPNLGISTLDIIIQGVKLTRSWEMVQKEIESLEEEIGRPSDWQKKLSQIKLTREEMNIFEAIKSVVTVRDVTMISKLNSFETCRLLMGFLIIELIQKQSMPSWVLTDNPLDELDSL